MIYILYRVIDRKTGDNRIAMHQGDRCWDFGFADVFDVAKALRVFNGIDISIDQISKTEYIRKYGKNSIFR